MDLIEDIGPILGIVAFLGFAVLALLIVLQAREVRRLREWAGRAPERALEADEATQAAAEERGEVPAEPSRAAALRQRLAGVFGPRWEEIDRRSPVDPRWFVAVLAAAIVVVAVLTSGFGLIGGDDEPRRGDRKAGQADKPAQVAVLNATQVDDPVAPVPAVSGLADAVAEQVVEPAGFKVTEKGDAPEGEEQTILMYEPEAEADAEKLAERIVPELGETAIEPMSSAVREVAGKAELALLVGQDDAGFGGLTADPATVP